MVNWFYWLFIKKISPGQQWSAVTHCYYLVEVVVVNRHWNSHPFYRLHSLIEIADKQQQDLEKEAKRSHLALEKAQKITEKRERAYKAKVEALETQVTFSEMILWPMTIAGKSSLLRSCLSGCHATLPRKGERCVTSRKTAAKETKESLKR